MDVVEDGGAVPPISTYGDEPDSTHNMTYYISCGS
jgi:hypothetical protein